MPQNLYMLTKIIGANADDNLGGGNTLNAVDDINGDGISDIIICADRASPKGRESAGTAYVIYGKTEGITDISDINLSNGLPLTQGFRIFGANAYDSMYLVIGAGDINHDGINDIIIGAPSPSVGGKKDAGISYIIYGKKENQIDVDLANFSIEQGFRILGANPNDWSGSSVSGAGDVNNDGISDIIIGARHATYAGKQCSGISYVIYGKKGNFIDIDLASFSTEQGFKILGANAEDNSGITVSRAGDVNNDGISDIIISAEGKNTGGIAYLIYGQKENLADIDLSNFLQTQGFKILAPTTAFNILAVNYAGDVNGDNIDDVIIGLVEEGYSYLIYGKSGGSTDINLDSFSLTQGFKISGSWVVSGAGDINNDSIADIITGNNAASPNGREYAGTSYLIYGESGRSADVDIHHLLPTDGFKILGANPHDWSGSSMSGSGDVNNDGITDIIIGAFGTSSEGKNNSGTIYVLYGQNAPQKNIQDIDSAQYSGFNNIGTNNNDYLIGNNIWGLNGDDILELIPINTGTLDGGNGTNTVSYLKLSAGVGIKVNLVEGAAIDSIGNKLINIQNLVGTNNPDIITGDANDNIIEGKGDADQIDGGAGTNTISYATSPSAVYIDLSAHICCKNGDAEGDIIQNFQNIIGSAYNDNLAGDFNDNKITAGIGNDILDGRGGSDFLTGGGGIDKFVVKNLAGSIVTISDFIAYNEQIDLTDFSMVHNIADLKISTSQGNTQIFLPNIEISLQNIDSSQITNNNFVFSSLPTPSPSSEGSGIAPGTITLIGSILGGISALVGLSWTIWQCKKNDAFCFKKAAAISATASLLNQVNEAEAHKFGEEFQAQIESSVIGDGAQIYE